MFVQMMIAPTTDASAFAASGEAWRRDLMPGAAGFLGSTEGVTPDGQAVVVARFSNEAAARANSERPEQSAWFARAEKSFSGPVEFHETSDVVVTGRGGSDDAGFVQIILAHISDMDRARELDERYMQRMDALRPDVIGSLRLDFGGGEVAEVVYFTSEADARAAESAELPEDLAEGMAEWMKVFAPSRFLDLPEPVLITP